MFNLWKRFKNKLHNKACEREAERCNKTASTYLKAGYFNRAYYQSDLAKEWLDKRKGY